MSAPTRPRRSAPAPRQVMHVRFRERRRAVRSALQRRRRRRLASAALLALVAAGAVAAARSPLFAITAVTVEGVAGERVDQVVVAAAIRPGQNLLTADLDQARARVALLPWVGEATVQRRPPATVLIAVAARRPAVVLRTGGAAWLLDAEGHLLAGGERPGLPAVLAADTVVPTVGRRITDAAVQAALAVHAQLPPELRADVDRYHAHLVRDLWVHLAGPAVWVRLGGPEQAAQKGRVVLALLRDQAAQAAREGRAVTPADEIDVRAPANPVVVPGGTGPPA